MKRILSLAAALVVLALLVGTLAACDMPFMSSTALAAKSERIMEGVEKLSEAKALDAEMDMKIELSSSAMSFITLEIPLSMAVKYNISDSAKPQLYFEMAGNLGALTGESNRSEGTLSLYYADGTAYAKTAIGDTVGIERYDELDLSEFESEIPFSISELQEMVFFDESMVKSASLSSGLDGSLTAKVSLDGNLAMRSFVMSLGRSVNARLEDADKMGDEELSELFDELGIDIGEVKISITVDKNNNITAYTLDVTLKTVDGGIDGGLLSGAGSGKARITVNAKYTPVDTDFTVPAPAYAQN